MRTDFLGSVLGWEGDRFTEVAYFTSEAAARQGEQLMSGSDKAAHYKQWLDQVDDITFIDLASPWLFS